MTLTTAPTSPPGPGADEVAATLRQISALYARLADAPVFALTDARLDARMAAAVRARAAADEMVARLAGEADASGAPKRAGASSTRAWLIGHHGMSQRDAARAVAHAAALGPLTEATRLAWARGEIDGDKAEAIATAVGSLPETADPARVEAVQAELLARAKTSTLRELRLACSRAVEPADPAEADRVRGERLAEQERDAYRRATFRGRNGLDGVARFSGTMPNLCLDMLMASLDAIASPRRDHLRGRDTTPADPDEQVPYANRLGMAFCDIVERIGETGLPADGVNATLVVTVDERSLRDRVGTATLSSGDDASAEGLRRIACNAGVIPMVLGGGSAVLDLGRERRLFDKAQRIALAVRDGGCVFAGCERPPGWTQAHHVTAWADGGRTDLSNAALLCGFHHRLIHSGDGWEIQMASDGIPETVPPDRVDRRRRPIRHQRHRQRQRDRQREPDRRRSRPAAG